MAACVETMFYTREKPWHGLGIMVAEAPASEDALYLAGLDWKVVQEPVFAEGGIPIPGYRANIRDTDRKVLGIVSDRYKVIQNREAFSFTDALLGDGVRYETAGSLNGGRRVWLLARMPEAIEMIGDKVEPYLVFTNTHDGTNAVKAAVTPVRVVCNNTLNLALSGASRSWSTIHKGDVKSRLDDARDTLLHARDYLIDLGRKAEDLYKIKLTDDDVNDLIEKVVPFGNQYSPRRVRTVNRQRDDLKNRYYNAPDLTDMGMNAYRFINAVSDHATHADPVRRTSSYSENLFAKTVDGHPLLDRAYRLLTA